MNKVKMWIGIAALGVWFVAVTVYVCKLVLG